MKKHVKRSSKRSPTSLQMDKEIERADQFVQAYRRGYKEMRAAQNDKERQVSEYLIVALREYEAKCVSYEEARHEPRMTYDEIKSLIVKDKDREPTDEEKKKILEIFLDDASLHGGLTKYDGAAHLDKCLDVANAYGMIHNSDNLIQALKDCQKTRTALRKDNEILSARIAQLERFNKIVTPIDKTKKRDDFGKLTP